MKLVKEEETRFYRFPITRYHGRRFWGIFAVDIEVERARVPAYL